MPTQINNSGFTFRRIFPQNQSSAGAMLGGNRNASNSIRLYMDWGFVQSSASADSGVVPVKNLFWGATNNNGTPGRFLNGTIQCLVIVGGANTTQFQQIQDALSIFYTNMGWQ